MPVPTGIWRGDWCASRTTSLVCRRSWHALSILLADVSLLTCRPIWRSSARRSTEMIRSAGTRADALQRRRQGNQHALRPPPGRKLAAEPSLDHPFHQQAAEPSWSGGPLIGAHPARPTSGRAFHPRLSSSPADVPMSSTARRIWPRWWPARAGPRPPRVSRHPVRAPEPDRWPPRAAFDLLGGELRKPILINHQPVDGRAER